MNVPGDATETRAPDDAWMAALARAREDLNASRPTADRREDRRPDFAGQFIFRKVLQLAARGRRVGLEPDDIEQELLTDLCARAANFDPSRSAWATFVRLIVNNCVSTLLDRWKRHPELVQLDSEPSGPRNESAHQRDLSLDLPDTLDKLDDRQRELCESLRHRNVTDTAREFGCSRQAVYREISKLRNVFENDGLRKYLPDARTLRDDRQ